MENNGDPGVYIAPGTSDISFSITNEGAYHLPLRIEITDDAKLVEFQNINYNRALFNPACFFFW